MDDKQLVAIKQLLEEHSREHNAQVAQTIQSTVNGKIDGIKEDIKALQGGLNAVSTKVTAHMNDFSTYKTDDEKWKVRAEPLIKKYENLSWLGDFIKGTAKYVAILAGGLIAWNTIKDFFLK